VGSANPIPKDLTWTFVVDQMDADDVKRGGVFYNIPMQISKISASGEITFDPINVE
tara:strand:+ start:614 stop:781 length:168 start_codon:yes stop_codon:yes gene_type:complete